MELFIFCDQAVLILVDGERLKIFVLLITETLFILVLNIYFQIAVNASLHTIFSFPRTIELTSSWDRNGMIPGWSSLVIFGARTHWRWIPQCTNVCGNRTYFLQMKKVPIFMMWPRKISFSLFFVMEMFLSAWGTL